MKTHACCFRGSRLASKRRGRVRSVLLAGLVWWLTGLLGGIQAANFAELWHAKLLGSWPGQARGPAHAVAVAGHYAYVAALEADLQVIDLGDLSQPQVVGGYVTFGFASGVAVSGAHVYLADSEGNLLVLDVTDPTRPRRIGGCVLGKDSGEHWWLTVPMLTWPEDGPDCTSSTSAIRRIHGQ